MSDSPCFQHERNRVFPDFHCHYLTLAAWEGIEPSNSSVNDPSGNTCDCSRHPLFADIIQFKLIRVVSVVIPFYLTLVHLTQFKGIIRRMFQPIVLTARK